MSCGNQSTYNRVANAGNLHRLSPFQMPFGILHNLTGKSSLTFSIEKCHFITAIRNAKPSALVVYEPVKRDFSFRTEIKAHRVQFRKRPKLFAACPHVEPLRYTVHGTMVGSVL